MSSEDYENKIAGVVQRFIEGLPQRVELIKNSIKSEIWGEAELLSHRLSGASLFGFPEIGAQARKIENAIKNQELNSLDALLLDLDQTIKDELSLKK